MQTKQFSIFIALACVFFLTATSSIAQQPTNDFQPTKSSKEDIKRAEQQQKENERLEKSKAKEDEKRKKQAEKERLERPAQITINASAERVRAIFVARVASNGATIEEATDYKIVFSKRITGMKGAFTQALLGNAYSEQPKYTATIVLAEIEKGKTLVTMSDAAVSVRMALGNVNRVDYTKDKKTRAEADSMLEQLKQAAESQEQEAVKQSVTDTQTVATKQPVAPTVLSAEGYNQAGVGLFSQKKFSEAEAAFREAVRLDTYNAAYHFNLGTSLNAQNKFDDAEKEIELATRLAPNEENYKKSLEVVRNNKNPRTIIKSN
jgi:tetratricopeptide (TPR) repeat protein